MAVLVASEFFIKIFLRDTLAQLFLRTKALGNGKERHDWAMVDAVDFHLVEHLKGVGQGLGIVGEDIVHLLTGLEPLLLGIAHTVGVVEILARGNAKQVVVGLSGLLVLEVAVVGAHQFDAVLLRKLHEHFVGLLLQFEGLAVGKDGRVGHLMALKFQVVVVTKEIMIPLTCLTSSLDVTLQNLGRHLSCDTSRANNEVFVVFLQVGTVGTRAHIVTVYPRITHQLDEVLVAIVVLGKYDEVITAHVALVLLTFFLASASHIHLASDDGFERLQPLLLPVFVDLGAIVYQFLDAEHHAVVGHGHTLHSVLDGLVHEMWNLRLAVEDGILCMNVQMNEIFH